jgi:hypothetical protein
MMITLENLESWNLARLKILVVALTDQSGDVRSSQPWTCIDDLLHTRYVNIRHHLR